MSSGLLRCGLALYRDRSRSLPFAEVCDGAGVGNLKAGTGPDIEAFLFRGLARRGETVGINGRLSKLPTALLVVGDELDAIDV